MTKISAWAAVTDVLDTDELVLARSSTTKKIDASDLRQGLRQRGQFLYSKKSAAEDPPDDEFDDTAGMSGASNGLAAQWTAVGGTEAAVALLEAGDISRYDLDTTPGSLLMQAGNATANRVEIRQDYTLADGDSILVAVNAAVGNYATNNAMYVGMSLNDNDTGYDAGNRIHLHIENQGQPSVLYWDGSTTIADHTWTPVSTAFLRIARSGLNYHGFLSHDGFTWQNLGVKVPAGEYTNVWLYSDCNAIYTWLPSISQFHWVRLGDNTFDPWAWR